MQTNIVLKEKRLVGNWWIPSEKEHVVKGAVSGSPYTPYKLQTGEKLHHTENAFSDSVPMVYGELDDGSAISLYNGVSRTGISDKLRQSVLFQHVLLGRHSRLEDILEKEFYFEIPEMNQELAWLKGSPSIIIDNYADDVQIILQYKENVRASIRFLSEDSKHYTVANMYTQMEKVLGFFSFHLSKTLTASEIVFLEYFGRPSQPVRLLLTHPKAFLNTTEQTEKKFSLVDEKMLSTLFDKWLNAYMAFGTIIPTLVKSYSYEEPGMVSNPLTELLFNRFKEMYLPRSGMLGKKQSYFDYTISRLKTIETPIQKTVLVKKSLVQKPVMLGDCLQFDEKKESKKKDPLESHEKLYHDFSRLVTVEAAILIGIYSDMYDETTMHKSLVYYILAKYIN